MSMLVVFQQMLVIFVLMMIGYFLTKKDMLSTITTKQISAIIVNICNPALVLVSAFDDSNKATNQDILLMCGITVVCFAVLILLGKVMGALLGAPKDQHRYYNMMTMFGNTGFIGIPVVSAVLGSEAVIYIAVFNTVFNLVVYTYGIAVLTKDVEGLDTSGSWKKIFSWGTLSGVLAIGIFLLRIPVLQCIQDGFIYMGRATTFLSMIVLGASLARMKWSEIFGEKRLYVFAVIRLLIVPIVTALILKPFLHNDLMVGVLVLLNAMPMGNMPLMLANTYELDTDILTKGILLTTILSMVTITITSIFL